MKRLIFFVAVAMILVSNGTALADEASEARWNLAKKGIGFVAGLTSGFLFHEIGHEIVARAEGADINWSDNRWTARASGNSLRNIAWAGFGAQVISTEVILGVEKIPKDNAYVLGWLAFNICNSLIYPLRNELQNGYGDLETLRRTGIDTAYVEIGLVAYGLLTAYRVYHNPKFIPYIKTTKEEIVLGVSWRF